MTVVQNRPPIQVALVVRPPLTGVVALALAHIRAVPVEMQIGDVGKAGCDFAILDEAVADGGLGGAIAECLAGICPTPLERVGLDDRFAECGPYLDLLDKYGMSVAAIASAVRRVLKRKSTTGKLENRSETTQNA